MRKVLDAKHIDRRKLAALKFWGLLDENSGRMKVTQDGQQVIGGDIPRSKTLRVISRVQPYMAVIERAAHRKKTPLRLLASLLIGMSTLRTRRQNGGRPKS